MESTLEYAGKTIALDKDGHLAHHEDWTEDLAHHIAGLVGIDPLADDHWKVINYMRQVYEEDGDAPSIRRLTKQSGVPTKQLYALLPKGPAKKAARIAGLPKPKGCI